MCLGADRKTLLQLHVVLVLSTLDYKCHVYSPASASLLNLLDPIHHLGLCLALSAFHSSPVESFCAESGLLSLSCCHALFSLQCYARFHQFPTPKITFPQPLLTKFSSHPQLSPPFLICMCTILSHYLFHNLNILLFYIHSSPQWLITSLQICSIISRSSKSDVLPLTLCSHFLEHISTRATCTPIYTNSSQSPHGSGFTVLFCSVYGTFNPSY